MGKKHPMALVCGGVLLLATPGCGAKDTEPAQEAASTAVTIAAEEDEVLAATGTTATTRATTPSGTALSKASTANGTNTTATTTKSGQADGTTSGGGNPNNSGNAENSSDAGGADNSGSSGGSDNSGDGNTAGGNSGDSASGVGGNSSNSGGNSGASTSGSGNSSSGNNSNNGGSNSSNSNSGGTANDSNADSGDDQPSATTPAQEQTQPPTEAPTEAPQEVSDRVYITLQDGASSASAGEGVSISGNIITISQAGRYECTGTLSDGQIVISATKEEKIDLYFNGVSLTSLSSAPVCVLSADTCTLHLVEGSTNYVADAAANDRSAAIFSKDDLTIKGSGTLTVAASKKHAIKSNNDVKVKNGSLYLSAPSAGIYGEDSVQVTGGYIAITACKDGIKACDSTELDGYVTVEGSTIDVQNALGNGIQADVSVTLLGGVTYVHSAKKGLNCDNASYAEGCYAEY